MILKESHRVIRVRSIGLWAAGVVVVWGIAGCASDARRHAFDDWLRIEHEVYGGRDSVDTPPASAFTDEIHRRGDAAGSDALGDTADLAGYLRHAALHNPGLEAAFNDWKVALERIPQARGLPDPRLSYRHFIENVETRVGPQRQAFGVSQMFPWFGKLELRGDVALEAARAAQARYEARKLRLFYDVRRAYYEYYYLARAIAVVQENRELVGYLEGVVRTRFQAAAAQHPDVIRAQIELGKLDDQQRSLEDLRGVLAADLNAAMNRPIDTPVSWPKSIPQVIGTLDGEALRGSLCVANPELQALQHEMAKHRTGVSLARKRYYPDVTAVVDYIGTGKRTGAERPSNSGQDVITAGFSINLPIWRDRYEAGVRESLARFGAATRTRAERQNMLAAALKAAIYHYEDAVRKIDLFRDTLVPKAQQALKTSEASFRTGQSTFVDVIDAQRVMLQFQLSYERALTDGATRLAQIEMLVGGPVRPRTMPRADGPADRTQYTQNNKDESDTDAK